MELRVRGLSPNRRSRSRLVRGNANSICRNRYSSGSGRQHSSHQSISLSGTAVRPAVPCMARPHGRQLPRARAVRCPETGSIIWLDDNELNHLRADSAAISVPRIIVSSRRQTLTLIKDVEVLWTRFLPLHHAEAGGIVRNTSRANGHACVQLHVPIHSCDAAIDVAEMTFFQLQHCDVRILAYRKCAQFRPVNFARGIHRGSANDIVERYAHVEELRHHVRHADNPVIALMQIGRHRVGNESLLHRRHGSAEPKAARSMAHIKDHATRTSFCQSRIDLAVSKNDGKLLRKDVSMNVSRPHFFQNQIFIGSVWAGPEIVHDRNVRQARAFDGSIYGSPRYVLRIPRQSRPVVRRFYADDDVTVLGDRGSACFGIHFIHTLFKPTLHAVPNDIQESENAHSGAVDDLFLFLQERLRPSRTRIYNRSDSGLEGHIGGNAERQCVHARLRREPVERRSSVTNMVVNVDQPGSYVELRDVNNFPGLISRNIFLDSCDLALEHSDVTHLINVIRGIDHMPAL